jgi:acyl-CoA dehydrogenase
MIYRLVPKQEGFMVSFDLESEQLALQQTARDFVAKEVIPVASEYDRSMAYPWPVLAKAHELGLLSSSVPEAVGGMGLNSLSQAVLGEELAYGCCGIQTAMGANDLAMGPLLLAANPEQMEEFGGALVKGLGQKVKGTDFAAKIPMAAYCVTEPGAGSDVNSIRSKVDKDCENYILNGEKMWITNGGVAKWLYVLATLDPSQGHKAMCAFVIPADLPGIVRGKKEINMGQRCSDTRAITFKDVRLDRRYLLGEEGQGFSIAMKAFDLSRPGTGAAAVGLARRAYAEALKYATERETFGKPIIRHQAVAFMLADMAKDIEAARMLVWKAAWLVDNKRRNTKLASMAKTFASDVAMRVTLNAVQIFGGYGYNTEYPVEKLLRDAKIFQIYEGTNQIQRLIVAREIQKEAVH